MQAVVAFGLYQPDLRDSNLQDLWWAGPSESGWGLNIARSGQKLFVSGFSSTTTRAIPPGSSCRTASGTRCGLVWYGDLYSPIGSYGAYNPGLLVVGSAIGTGSLSNSRADTGHWATHDRERIGRQVDRPRYVFGTRGDAPGKEYTGIFWGGVEQNGWGPRDLAPGRHRLRRNTYGDDGKATWFFMPAGRRAAGVFSGPLYKASGATWRASTTTPTRRK